MELMVQALNLLMNPRNFEMYDSKAGGFNDDAMDIYVEVEVLEEGHAKALLSTELTTPKGKVIQRTHFIADAFVGERVEINRVLPDRLEMPRDPKLSRSDIYSRYFHGPRFQVLGDVSRMGEDGVEVEPLADRPQWLSGAGTKTL